MVLRQEVQGLAVRVGGAGRTRSSVALTTRGVEALKPAALPYRVSDSRCRGLAARVAQSGVVTWDLAFRVKGTGKVRRVSLGAFPAIGLEAARNRANAITEAAREGRDLLKEKAQEQADADARVSVDLLIVKYMHRRVTGKLRTAKEIEARLRRTLAPLLNLPAEGIRRKDIRPLLDATFDSGVEREAEKRRQTVGALFRWALSQDLVEIDPTAGLTAYDGGVLRERVLSADEIRTFWEWLGDGAMPPLHADVLRLELALGARCGELAGMERAEIDATQWLWTLPATRSKNKKARITPIVGIARQIVAARLEIVKKGPLFPSETGSPLTSAHIGHSLKHRRAKMPIAHFVTHDLRRTVATGLVDLGFPLDLVAAVVGHEVGGKDTRTLVRHYVRTDQIDRKRAALEAWDARLNAIISGQTKTNVTELAAVRAAG